MSGPPRPFRANLRSVFGEAFTVMDLADPLFRFDGDRPGGQVREVLEREGVTLAGVIRDGETVGYVLRDDLDDGPCRGRMHSFRGSQVVWEDYPLHRAIPTLVEGGTLFVSILNAVGAVALTAHLQKPAARMFLFGAVTLIEMYMARRIRDRFPNDAWMEDLSPKRLSYARRVRDERVRRGLETPLLDCLQFVDKAGLLVEDEALRQLLELTSATRVKAFFKDVETLRNELAHGHALHPDSFPAMGSLARRFEALVESIDPLGDSRPLDRILSGD